MRKVSDQPNGHFVREIECLDEECEAVKQYFTKKSTGKTGHFLMSTELKISGAFAMAQWMQVAFMQGFVCKALDI